MNKMNNVDITNSNLDFIPEDNYDKISYHSWFPTVIGVVDCPFYNEVRDEFIKIFNITENEDKGLIYETIHHIKEPFIFQKYTKWVEQQVNIYAKFHKFPCKYTTAESWLIDYAKYRYNPWHKHNGSTISTVFFLLTDKEDSHTRFRSNSYGDMRNPIRSEVINSENGQLYNTITAPTCTYAPIPGRLLIFRSDTEHMADYKNKNKRVIISQNFVENDKP
jgi:hypothetical protein